MGNLIKYRVSGTKPPFVVDLYKDTIFVKNVVHQNEGLFSFIQTLSSGNYKVKVTDNDGCTDSFNVVVGNPTTTTTTTTTTTSSTTTTTTTAPIINYSYSFDNYECQLENTATNCILPTIITTSYGRAFSPQTCAALQYPYSQDMINASDLISHMSIKHYYDMEYMEVVGYTSNTVNHKLKYNGSEITVGQKLYNNGNPNFEFGPISIYEVQKETFRCEITMTVRFKLYCNDTLTDANDVYVTFYCDPNI